MPKRLMLIEHEEEEFKYKIVPIRITNKMYNRIKIMAGQYSGGCVSLYIRSAIRNFEPTTNHLKQKEKDK
jgi:hypothetical protein